MQNMKTAVISLIVFAAVIGALVWFDGREGSNRQAAVGELSGGILTAKDNHYDFGSIKLDGGLISHEFMLENMSDKAAKIGKVYTSCMCTTAQIIIGGKTYGPFRMPGHLSSGSADVSVNPGEKVVVKAIFDPAAHGPAGVGPIERQISVYTSASKDPIILEFKAVVTP